MIDYALVFQSPVNEKTADPRLVGNTMPRGADQGPNGMPGVYDWKVWSNSGFGKRLQSYLRGGDGFSYEVSDFGRIVVVRASYHCVGTGKHIGKTFAIFFDDPNKGNGQVFSQSTRWRSISSVDQASSYINGVMNSLYSQAR